MITDNAISISELLNGYSIEVNPRDVKTIDSLPDRVDAGAEVYLTWIPGSDPMEFIAAAAKLRRYDFWPVPHLGARHIESKQQLEVLTARLAGDAGVDRVLLVGGDRSSPAGPYDSTLAIMQAGVLQQFGILRVAIAGFPEGNPSVSSDDMGLVLEKVNFSRKAGLEPSIVTQFCFSAEPIISWLGLLRSLNLNVPVRIGLAGPAGLLTLTRYAIRCGVGNSVRVLTEKPSFAKLLTEQGPGIIIRDLASCSGGIPSFSGLVRGFHFFLFGGLQKTMDWIGSERGH